MSKSKTKADLMAELKKLRAAYKKKKASGPSRSYASKPRAKKKSGSVAGDIGAAVGGLIGQSALGRVIGKGASALYSKITGHGDYKVASNSLLMGTDPPSFNKSGRGTIVRHREFIQDIKGSTDFSVTSIPINPGMNVGFPWLSQIAANYEEYVIRGMIFEFKSTSASALNSTNTALGTVVMATRYNVLMPSFASKTEMENYEFCTTTKPAESAIHAIECAVGEAPLHCLYTRQFNTAIGDLRMYDLGNFQIATVGMQAVATIGELWVSYDVELLKPRLTTIVGGEADHYAVSTVNYGFTNPFGDTPLARSANNFGSSITGGAGNCTLILPDWNQDYYFMLLGQWLAPSAVPIGTIPNPLFNASGTLNRVQLWNGNQSTLVRTGLNETSTTIFYQAVYKFTASSVSKIQANRTLTWGNQTNFASITGGDIWIIDMPTPYYQGSLTASLGELKAESKEEAKSESKEEKKEVKPRDEDDEEDYDEEFEAFMRHKREIAMAKKVSPPVEPPSETPTARSKSIK